MMKYITVEELIDSIINDDGGYWRRIVKAELLRRFDVLGKENESLMCCGNCKKHKQGYTTGCSFNGMSSSDYCQDYQTDGLTRADREGK